MAYKVNGTFFAEIRKKLKKSRGLKHRSSDTEINPYPIGTQKWLAHKSGVSVKLIQQLEKKNLATARTIDLIGKALEIDGFELILDSPVSMITCAIQDSLDVRPAKSPFDHEDSFQDSSVMLTLDPIEITNTDTNLKNIRLKKITADLTGTPQPVSFQWIYEVMMTGSGKGWLGEMNDGLLHSFVIPNTQGKDPIVKSIMLQPGGLPITSWKTFVEMIESDECSKSLKLSVLFDFNTFQKQVDIFLPRQSLRLLFSEGRRVRNAECPYRAQLDLIRPF